MHAAEKDAYEVLDYIYTPKVKSERLIKRDQSTAAKQQRDLKVGAVATGLRDRGLDEQADAIQRFHTLVDEYVDRQQAVDPKTIRPGVMRDDGRIYLVRTYDHTKRLLDQIVV